jgi:hypothetical protein
MKLARSAASRLIGQETRASRVLGAKGAVSFPKQDAVRQSRSAGRVPGPDCVPVGVGQGVDASSWSLMELASAEKSTSVIEAFLPSMKFA